MKKALFMAGFALAAFVTNAQKVSFGVKAGANFSTVKTNDEDFNDERAMRTTYHAGLVTDFSVSPNFSIQPHLLIQGKGVSLEHDGHKDRFKFTSLDIPVNLLYKSSGFFIGGGPNLGINLNGKLEAEDDPAENFDFEFGSDEGQIKRINFGVNLLTGYRLKNGLFFSGNYLAGISNWSNSSNDKWRNNLFGISVGYMFK